MVKLKLIPQNEKFYGFFQQAADNVLAASEKLVDLFDHYDNIREKASEIKRLENEGDKITHSIMGNLHSSLVTPLDREDIVLVAEKLDDMLDMMEGATKRMFLYRIKTPTPRAIEITHIINKVAVELTLAMPYLSDRGKRKCILPHCVEIRRLENEADNLRHAALSDLFDEEKNIKETLKWRDIYQNLEDAVDAGEDVANALEGIVLKTT